MRLSLIMTAIAVGAGPAAFSQIVRYTPPGNSGISYGVNIPNTTASSGSGPIYFQMKAPNDLQWFALGQGSRMAGANIFVVYASSANNITVSSRVGKGHSAPKFSPEIQLSLIEGTGIDNGVMTANVQCDNCINWYGDHGDIDLSSTSWIWALKRGEPLDSTSLSQSISLHDSLGIFSLDLTEAKGGSAANPFSIAADYTSIVVEGTQFVELNSSHIILRSKRIAHGGATSIAFVLLFPIFALTLHIVPSSKTVLFVHAPLQLFAIALALAGFGFGIFLARDLGETNGYHVIIGSLVILWFAVLQPIIGFLQHLYFRRTGRKSLLSYIHRWFGRILGVLGILNGGVGFRFAERRDPGIPHLGMIVYGIVAATVVLIYVLVIASKRSWFMGRALRQGKLPLGQKPDAEEREGSEKTHLCRGAE